MLKARLISICQDYHEYVHLLFSLSAYLVAKIFNLDFDILGLAVVIIAGYLPDIDHLFFMFGYGRHTKYAQCVIGHLKNKDLPSAIEHCRINHKSNHFILSHNLLTPLISLALFFYITNPLAKLFWLSFTFHFVFDVLEDLLTFGRLNPNWYLKFKSN